LLGDGSNRIVFDIAGNNYRMICKYHFGQQEFIIHQWIGTHAEYTKLCNDNDQYTVNIIKNITMETLHIRSLKLIHNTTGIVISWKHYLTVVKKAKAVQDEIELLTLLIEKYDERIILLKMQIPLNC